MLETGRLKPIIDRTYDLDGCRMRWPTSAKATRGARSW
jgi:hypothetical protein